MTTFKRVRRFGTWVTFLLLELISLTLVVEFNQYQNDIFAHSANVFSGNLHEFSNSIGGFFSLKNKNERLLAENARLKNQLSKETSIAVLPEKEELAELKDSAGRFEYIPANVINKTLIGQYNYFTIDRGEKDSIFSHMGVVGDQGIVGIVRNVSNHHAKVMTILHPLTRISASIQGSSNFGSLFWMGKDPTLMTLEDIPRTVEVKPGNTVITSGYSNIFPPHIPIGVVEESEIKPGENSHTITVRLINELSSMPYVYVVKDHMAEDLQKLEE